MFALFHRVLFLQASEEYFTYKEQEVSISIGNPPVTATIPLVKGKRQTLLIPPTITEEWVLVSNMNLVL